MHDEFQARMISDLFTCSNSLSSESGLFADLFDRAYMETYGQKKNQNAMNEYTFVRISTNRSYTALS